MSDPIRGPDARRVAESSLSQFAARVRHAYAEPDGDYRALGNWSIEHREQFWQVSNTDALANPEALEYFRNLPELGR